MKHVDLYGLPSPTWDERHPVIGAIAGVIALALAYGAWIVYVALGE